MLIIRLSRFGRRNKAIFRVVVAEHSRAVKGKYLEKLGSYNTTVNPKVVVLDEEKIRKWLQKGAKVSDAVAKILEKYAQDKSLLKDFKIDQQLQALRRRPPKPKKKKEAKSETPSTLVGGESGKAGEEVKEEFEEVSAGEPGEEKKAKDNELTEESTAKELVQEVSDPEE